MASAMAVLRRIATAAKRKAALTAALNDDDDGRFT